MCDIFTARCSTMCLCLYIIDDEDSMKGNYHIEQCVCVCEHMNRDSVTEHSMIIIESSSVMSSSINLKVIYWSTNNRNNNNHLTCYSHDFQQHFFPSIFFLNPFKTNTTRHCSCGWIISGQMK